MLATTYSYVHPNKEKKKSIFFLCYRVANVACAVLSLFVFYFNANISPFLNFLLVYIGGFKVVSLIVTLGAK